VGIAADCLQSDRRSVTQLYSFLHLIGAVETALPAKDFTLVPPPLYFICLGNILEQARLFDPQSENLIIGIKDNQRESIFPAKFSGFPRKENLKGVKFNAAIAIAVSLLRNCRVS
jgi:hypothetical protein